MTQICVSIGEISLALSQLRDLVNQQRFTEYWEGGLTVVCQHIGAVGARLYLVDAQLPRNDLQVNVGDLLPTQLDYLVAWEEALLDAAAEKEHEQAVVWSVKGITAQRGQVPPLTALHLCLWMANTLQGMATFVFADTAEQPDKPTTQPLTDSDSAALATIFQLFADNGLHAFHLVATQRRLDQANLLSQISQAITSSLDLRNVFNQATETGNHGLER